MTTLQDEYNSHKKTGGTCRPTRSPSSWDHRQVQQWPPLPEVQGMTLRDHFAAKAMPEVFRQYANQANAKNQWDAGWQMYLAKDAYAIADAMLKAREQ
jgi:hypothetical protein